MAIKGIIRVLELPDDGVLVSLRTKMIRDPISGYITLSLLERDLIDLPIVQRLRRLHQLQTAFLVYPGAEHSRFQHSLGVMHLAGKFAVALIRRTYGFRDVVIRKMLRIPNLTELGVDDISDIFSAILGIRIAGLFHDIGHGPFSHAFDEIIIDKSSDLKNKRIYSHEDVGYFIYRNHLREKIERIGVRLERNKEIPIHVDSLLESLDYILAPRSEMIALREKTKLFIRALRYVLREFIYPADILDFVLRDSYYTGAREYGMVDVDRLLKFSVITTSLKPAHYIAPDIALFDNALNTLRAFLMSRFWLFNNVYFHKFSRIMDYAIKKLLSYTHSEECIDFIDAILSIVDGGDVSKYILLDDYYVLYKALEKGKKAAEYAKMVLYRKPPIREIFYHEIRIPLVKVERDEESRLKSEPLESVLREMREVIADKLEVSEEDLIIDYPPIKFFPDNPYLPARALIVIFMRGDKPIDFRHYTVQDATAGMALNMTVLRIFLEHDIARQVERRIHEELLRDEIYKEFEERRILKRFTEALLFEFGFKEYGVTM